MVEVCFSWFWICRLTRTLQKQKQRRPMKHVDSESKFQGQGWNLVNSGTWLDHHKPPTNVGSPASFLLSFPTSVKELIRWSKIDSDFVLQEVRMKQTNWLEAFSVTSTTHIGLLRLFPTLRPFLLQWIACLSRTLNTSHPPRLTKRHSLRIAESELELMPVNLGRHTLRSVVSVWICVQKTYLHLSITWTIQVIPLLGCLVNFSIQDLVHLNTRVIVSARTWWVSWTP